MSQQPLLKKMDEAIERVRFLERENEETQARVRTLENEAKELRGLIALAESKADEILRPGQSAPRISGEERSTARAGKGLQDLVEEGASRGQGDIRRR
jgi:hypothetical protein